MQFLALMFIPLMFGFASNTGDSWQTTLCNIALFGTGDVLKCNQLQDTFIFKEGNNIDLDFDNATKTITFTASGGNQPNEKYCPTGEVLKNYNSTTNDFDCITDQTTLGGGDNLGNHQATQFLNMSNNYVQFGEISTLGSSPTNTSQLYATDQNGRTVMEFSTPSGQVLRLSRDNTFIGKIDEAGGITKGEVVYISGATGANEQIKKWIADGSISTDLVGVAYESGANNDFIHIITLGKLQGIDTDSFNVGDKLYASATVAGGLTSTPPVHPNLRAEIGIVTNKNMVTGEVYIEPLIVRGNYEGTRQDIFRIGDDTTGLKSLYFRNGFDYNVTANPSADRNVTLPDKSGTVAFLDDVSGILSINSDTTPAQIISGSSGNTTVSTTGGTTTINLGNNVLFTSLSQIITSKSINADSNTITNIDNNEIKAGAGIDATKIADGSVTSSEFQFINTLSSNAQTQLDAKYSATNRQTNIVTSEISNDQVDNTKLSNMATQTFKGRTTGGTGDPEDLSATQATAMLNVFTSALKGLVPLSGGGTTNFLRADGTWATPSGGSNHNLLSSTHSDTVVQTVSRGSLIYGDSTPNWNELTVGGSGTVLTSDGTDVSWQTPTGGNPRTTLSADVTSTSTSAYTDIFTIALTASKYQSIDFDIIADSDTTGDALQFRTQLSAVGATGNCQFATPTTATATAFDLLVVGAAGDTAETAILNTDPFIVRVYCAILEDASASNLILQFQNEVTGTVKVRAGSSYLVTVQP